jgi:hypothetical protein
MELDPLNRIKTKKEIVCKCGTKTTHSIRGKCQRCYSALKAEQKKNRRQYNIV